VLPLRNPFFETMADHADDGGDDNIFVYTGGSIPQHLRDTITHARVHKTVKIITRESFRYCRNLVSVEMHDGVEIVEQLAFAGCFSLRGINLSGVRVIEEYVFHSTALENVEFGDKLESIGQCAFATTSLRKIQLPKVRVIGNNAFASCYQLTEAKLPGIETIGLFGFYNCRCLRRVDIPLKCDLLGEKVFYDCENLSQVKVDLVGGIDKTISSLLLERWRNEMKDEIDRINRDLPNTGRYVKTVEIQQWMERVMRRIEHYKNEHYILLKEFTTLLELALWKAKLDESQDERSLGSGHHQPAKKAKIDTKASRQEKRITSGANIVIKNVLSFLKLE